jgi:hypothetical protein
MKLNLRSICITSSLAVLMSFASIAHATIINGGVYNTPAYPAPLGPHGPGTAATATFVVSDINFFAPAPAGPAYTVAGFLNSGGSLLSISNAGVGASTLNNKALELVWTNYLVAGKYTITHDDGVFLYINGSSTCAICSGNPTKSIPSSFTIASAGNYSFDLWYAEVNGAPATLNAPFASAPEPSSFILLGSGLLSAAGIIRRRLAR